MAHGFKRIRVAAGILIDAERRVLLSERTGDSAFAGLWEFPGGKLRDDETADIALRRELAEEIGVELVEYEHLMALEHDYADRRVSIDFYLVSTWRGRPTGREGQAICWQPAQKLSAEMLLPADGPVVEALRKIDPSG